MRIAAPPKVYSTEAKSAPVCARRSGRTPDEVALVPGDFVAAAAGVETTGVEDTVG